MNRRQMIAASVVATLLSLRPTLGKGLVSHCFNWLGNQPPSADGWQLYEIGGTVLFPIYGENGSLSTRQVCYLLRQKPNIWACLDGAPLGRDCENWEALAIAFSEKDFAAVGYKPDAIEKLIIDKVSKAISHGKPVKVNLDGGQLPRPEECV